MDHIENRTTFEFSFAHLEILPRLISLVHANNRGGELRAEEATGVVTLRVKSGRYSVIAVIRVPDGYPLEGCEVELRSYNFPKSIAHRHLLQVGSSRSRGTEQLCIDIPT